MLKQSMTWYAVRPTLFYGVDFGHGDYPTFPRGNRFFDIVRPVTRCKR